MPKYQSFDKAHNVNHANKTIENSLLIAKDYDVDINKVYVIAAYHDIGLIGGRDGHEKLSAKLLMEDFELKKWFNENDLAEMAEAVEDHRASNDHPPRNLYGKIVSEADRDVEYTSVLTRTIQYSLKQFPDYHGEQHFLQVQEHMQEKYGENGYLKLWLDTEINRRNLSEIRNAMRCGDKFKSDFMSIFDELTRSSQ